MTGDEPKRRVPSTTSSTVSSPPWRSADWASAASERAVGSGSTRTVAPAPLTTTRSSPSRAAAACASSSESTSRSTGS